MEFLNGIRLGEYGIKPETLIDEIYEKYKRGEDVYLGCFCQQGLKCHGDIIIEKLQKNIVIVRLLTKIKLNKTKSTNYEEVVCSTGRYGYDTERQRI